MWEAEQLDQAMARFAEIASPGAAGARFENTASRAWREVIAAWRGRDLERFAALQPRLLRYRDHRRLFQLDLDREGFLEFSKLRPVFRNPRMSLLHLFYPPYTGFTRRALGLLIKYKR